MNFIDLPKLPVMSEPDGWNSRTLPLCVNYLVALFAIQRQILRFSAGWLPGISSWEAKIATGQFVFEDAQNAEILLKRLHELKMASAEYKSVENLSELINAVAGCKSGNEWLYALYRNVKPWFVRLLERYLAESDPVMDAPTHHLIRSLIANQKSQMNWFEQFSQNSSPPEQADIRAWLEHSASLLEGVEIDAHALRLCGPACDSNSWADLPDFKVASEPCRDPGSHLVREWPFPAEMESYAEKRFVVFWSHTQEMQFAESLAAILYETAQMPWAFHYDLARHVADEVRHSRMGQVRLQQLGIKLEDVPMMTQHYSSRVHLDPLERFCLMTLVLEADSFESKRANVKMFEQEGDKISVLYETYDIRDEMLHTGFGHTWVPIMLRVNHDSRSVQDLVNHCRKIISGTASVSPAKSKE
jgi:hypothetical protein